MTANKLRNKFAFDGRPDMVDTMWTTYFFRIIERFRAVAMGDDEDVRWRKDLECRFKRCGDQVGGL